MNVSAIRASLDAAFPDVDRQLMDVLSLAEESGEFVGSYRRWRGMARRSGTFQEVIDELADVAMTAYVIADSLGIDLDEAVQMKAARRMLPPQVQL